MLLLDCIRLTILPRSYSVCEEVKNRAIAHISKSKESITYVNLIIWDQNHVQRIRNMFGQRLFKVRICVLEMSESKVLKCFKSKALLWAILWTAVPSFMQQFLKGSIIGDGEKSKKPLICRRRLKIFFVLKSNKAFCHNRGQEAAIWKVPFN